VTQLQQRSTIVNATPIPPKKAAVDQAFTLLAWYTRISNPS
jgi:hypothetical protein